jgi:DNA (cytosine-5)-methyltransferase 1
MPARTVAEFFAGVGLVRKAVEQEGFRVVFANDIDKVKAAVYAENGGGATFRCADVRDVRGADVPDVDLATASFPCTDLSLAGNRAGLRGRQSGLFWEFIRIVREMGDRRPRAVLLENVAGFATSNGGKDLRESIRALNKLGYKADLVELDARRFTPQSRKRVFVIGSLEPLRVVADWAPCDLRPSWIQRFVEENPQLDLHAAALPTPPSADSGGALSDIVDRVPTASPLWWEPVRAKSFRTSLSKIQAERLVRMERADRLTWATTYRRTRFGKPVWEIRGDGISGCLRTTRGGSSKQAVVEAGRGAFRVRWMSAMEYARLQGAPDLRFGVASENQARFALGDAVCVPAVAWLARHYLGPLLKRAGLCHA